MSFSRSIDYTLLHLILVCLVFHGFAFIKHFHIYLWQDYASGKARAYTSATTASFKDVSDALGQELSVKYSLISTEINSELKPVVDLLENELARIGQQIDMVQQEMTRMHRLNDFYLQDMSQPMVDGFIRLRYIRIGNIFVTPLVILLLYSLWLLVIYNT